jgi:putative transposase
VVSRAVVVATGVTAHGNREVLGIEVGDSEDKAFWVGGFRASAPEAAAASSWSSPTTTCASRGHASGFVGASSPRCRVHVMSNVLSKVPKASAEMVAAAIRTMFAHLDAEHVPRQLQEVTAMLSDQFPEVSTMLADAGRGPARLHRLPLASWRTILVDQSLSA